MSQPPLPPPIPTSQTSPNRTLMLVLSYLGILALIPLLAEKDDPEVQWHAKHGIVMTVAAIAFFIGLQIILFIIGMIPGIGWAITSVLGCASILLWFGVLALFIVAMVKAVKGERMVLPFITEYADKWR